MQQIKKNLEISVKGKKSVFLFTGDKGSTLLMDAIKGIDTDGSIDIVFIDTGCHFDEIMDYVKSFGSKIEIIKAEDVSVDNNIGMEECCNQRKSAVLKDYLSKIKAECLIVPFIDEESDSEVENSYLKWLGNIKVIKPLSDLTERDIWIRIRERKLPFSKIYNRGYRFVDCKCCMTRHGRIKQHEADRTGDLDKETEKKLKALGYM